MMNEALQSTTADKALAMAQALAEKLSLHG